MTEMEMMNMGMEVDMVDTNGIIPKSIRGGVGLV